MTQNDVLKSVRYMLNVSDAKLVEIVALGGFEVTLPEIVSYLKHEEEPGYVAMPQRVMAHFLDGLITHKRGPKPGATGPAPRPELPETNNTVLKKIRVAFELKDEDVIRAIEKPGVLKVSKSELGAFFRKPDHRNYRDCGDQYLRNLLKGLS